MARWFERRFWCDRRFKTIGLSSALVGALSLSFAKPALSLYVSLDEDTTQRIESSLVDLSEFPLATTPAGGVLVASSEQLSQTEISRPSLSWIQDQVGRRYGSDRLVVQWQAYQVVAKSAAYVDVIVDEQIWELLSYFERYAFISQFGTTAKQYGYHLRVFHTGDLLNYRDQQDSGSSRLVLLRGAHVCNFANVVIDPSNPVEPGAASEILCEIVLNDANRREVL